MVLGRSVSKCVLCPQRYNCGTYMGQINGNVSNVVDYNVNNTRKVSKANEQTVVMSTSKSAKESTINDQEITSLFSSIQDTLNKTNKELSDQNALLKQELEQVKEEIEKIKQQEKSYLIPDSNLQVEIVSEDQVKEETGLDLYNKSNSTILREKKTIFGTKKWVEEKK